MRRFALVVVAALLPVTAQAQPPGLAVIVTNEPLAVEVTNDAANPVEITGEVEVTKLPPTSAPARFQLVGFTTAALPGDSGLFAFTLACQAEFLGSRFCTSREVVETVDVPTGLSGNAC